MRTVTDDQRQQKNRPRDVWDNFAVITVDQEDGDQTITMSVPVTSGLRLEVERGHEMVLPQRWRRRS